jgi:hypothetical protein
VAPADAVPTPEAPTDETVVVKATETVLIVSPDVALASPVETTAAAPAFYVPAMFEAPTTNSDVAPGHAVEVQPLMMAGSPSEAMEAGGFMQNWWQRGAAMLLACLGALAPFSSRGLSQRDETDSAKLER